MIDIKKEQQKVRDMLKAWQKCQENIQVDEQMAKYHADLDVNCRCSFKPITVKDVPAPRKDWAIKPEDVGTVKVVDIKGGE